MESYLINEIELNNFGIYFFKGYKKREKVLNKVIPWSFFYKENAIFKFKEEYAGCVIDLETDFSYTPFIVPFYWVDIIAPNSAQYKDFHLRIQFPKGEEQRDEFKNMVTYYIFKELNLLDSINTKETNDIILKMFKF